MVVTTITFTAPDKALNMNDRMHWAPKAERVRTWRHAAKAAARNAKLRNIGPTIVHVTLSVNSSGRRDPSNWYPTVKAICDGLTDAGLWPDDDSTHVATLEPTLVKRPGRSVDVELIPWERAA